MAAKPYTCVVFGGYTSVNDRVGNSCCSARRGPRRVAHALLGDVAPGNLSPAAHVTHLLWHHCSEVWQTCREQRSVMWLCIYLLLWLNVLLSNIAHVPASCPDLYMLPRRSFELITTSNRSLSHWNDATVRWRWVWITLFALHNSSCGYKYSDEREDGGLLSCPNIRFPCVARASTPCSRSQPPSLH